MTCISKGIKSFILIAGCLVLEYIGAHRGQSGHVFHTRSQASSFLVNLYNQPLRVKRSAIPERCVDDEFYCEENMPDCFLEDTREVFCATYSCSAGYACYMSVPCPAHPAYTCTEDLCAAEPCHHGGTCLNGYNNGFACKCIEGTGGTTCKDDTVNECASSPCLNGATCTDAISRANCTCAPGYEGDNCEIDIDECARYTPCLNGGTCVDQVNGYVCYCEEDYTGTTCDIDMCSPVVSHGIDVIFVMDMSESEADGFQKQKDYIKDFISEFPVGPNETQIGCVSFSNEATAEFYLHDNADNESVIASVDSLEHEGGASNMGKALQLVHEEMLSLENGARASAVKYVIVLADGLFSDLVESRTNANIVKQTGTTIFAVSFGESIQHDELIVITGHPSRVFSPNNKDGVNTILKLNVMEACPDCYRATSDVAIAMEMSSNTNTNEYYERLASIRLLLSALLISPTDIRVSYVTYGESVNEVFRFDSFTNRGEVISAIHKTQPRFDGISNITRLLDYFLDEGFSITKGSRSDHRKLLIVTTNAAVLDQDSVISTARTLLESDIILVTISTGRYLNTTLLNSITSDPTYVFSIGITTNIDKSVLRVLDDLMSYDVCNFD